MSSRGGRRGGCVRGGAGCRSCHGRVVIGEGFMGGTLACDLGVDASVAEAGAVGVGVDLGR